MKPLTRIAYERKARDAAYAKANRKLAVAIDRAHEAGSTWAQIADAMGLTRQGLGLFREREAKR